MRHAAVLLLALAACGRQEAQPVETPQGDGARLEAAARAAGLVADESQAMPVGVFAADTDRVCVLPDRDGDYRIGASVDLGEHQRCAARGTASGKTALAVDFGRDCRFEARFEGDRITFPAVLPAGCEVWCEGRTSLAALAAERLSDSVAEATRTVGADGAALCS